MRNTYAKEFDRMQQFTDALITKQKEDSERQRLQHREVPYIVNSSYQRVKELFLRFWQICRWLIATN